MKLKELLWHTRHNILRDSRAPQLWTDDELCLYFNEGETIFARRTHCLVSEDEDFCTLDTVAGRSRYALSDKVIFIMEVTNEEGIPLLKRSRSRMPYNPSPGKPTIFTADAGHKNLQLYPTPDDVYTLRMLVAHKPIKRVTHAEQEFSIPEEYHTALAQYAAWKALTNNAPEGSDTVDASVFERQWLVELRDAKRDAYHMRQSPGARATNNWTHAQARSRR